MSAGRFVAAPVAVLDASGSGNIESQEYAAAAHTAITHIFRMDVSKGSDLFTAFSWADANNEGMVDASAGDTDISGAALDQAKFAAILAQVLNGAVGGKLSGATGSAIATAHGASALGEAYTTPYALDSGAAATTRYVLKSEIRKEVEDQLDVNGVLEYLAGDSLGSFQFAIDASGGAADMASKLAVSAALRNMILQFPNRVSEFAGETEGTYNHLPVIVGDELTFVFNVSPVVTITQSPETGNMIAAANNASGAAAEPLGTAVMPPDNGNLNGLALTTGTRKVAFIVKVIA